MGGFFDFERMKMALDEEYPKASRDDIETFCSKHGVFGGAKQEFLRFLNEKGYDLFWPISLTPFFDGK